jgi:hypothetical protein
MSIMALRQAPMPMPPPPLCHFDLVESACGVVAKLLHGLSGRHARHDSDAVWFQRKADTPSHVSVIRF